MSALRRSRHLLYVLATLVMLAFVDLAESKKLSRLLTAEEVATVWIGISFDETSLMRLNLRRDGTAALARSFLDQEPERVEFGTWVLREADLSLETGSPSLPSATGKLSGEQLTLTIRGVGWNQSFRMRREAPLASRWRRIAEVNLGAAL